MASFWLAVGDFLMLSLDSMASLVDVGVVVGRTQECNRNDYLHKRLSSGS